MQRIHRSWFSGSGWLLATLLPASLFLACSGGSSGGGSGGSESSGGAPASGGTGPSGGASSSGGTTSSGGATGSGGEVSATGPTWAADLAPIIYRECVGCHREGGVGPFPLETYEQAADVAAALAGETAERHMPPMPVDGSGTCNTYANARWLTEQEIDLFRAWYDAETPLGDPTLAPALPAPPAALEAPDLTLDPGAEYTPNEAFHDDYRCFIIDPGLNEEQFIVAYEVVPGDARVVHHAIVYEPSSEEAEAEAEALDADEAGEGYTCFGGAGVDSEPRVLWAPGGGYTELPQETGVPLAAGRKLILQVHYNVHDGTHPDRTTVKLALADEVPFPASYQPIADLDMILDPGMELATTTTTVATFGQSAVVHGVMPHMHTLGRELRVTTNADDAEHCLVSVDRWDFHSQNAWWYSEPLSFDSVDSVSITCGYDTRSRTEPVTWGEGTEDEMCLTYLYVTQPE